MIDIKPRIDPYLFEKQFEAFKIFVEEQFRVPFLSFASNPYTDEQEGYKYEIYRTARDKLTFQAWKESDIGSGDIIAATIDSIEFQKNNLVQWQSRYGDESRPHHPLHAAASSPELTKTIEQCLFNFYHKSNVAESFNGLIAIFGKKYSFIAYLFFVKDSSNYLPIAPRYLDRAFELLGADFKTSHRCSWDNYSTYIKLISNLKQMLSEALSSEVSLLDAHSFAWILASQMEKQDKLADVKEYLSLNDTERDTVVKSCTNQGQFRESLVENIDMNSLTISNHYNNDDICNAFLCAPQGGMRRSHKTNTLVLVANHTKSLYEDEWKLDTMNYTGMGSKGDQSLEFAQNKTLAESNENGVNVHFFEVFTDKVYTYQGQVTLIDKPFQEVQDDEDGNSRSVWIFPLKRKDGSTPVIPKVSLDKTFERKVKKVLTLTLEELKSKASKSQSKPGSRVTTSKSYQRNPAVKAYTLKRADGVCELCEQDAPFKNKNGKPYLEVHHVKQLADDGDDTIENAVALCPNCHRKMHSLGLKSDIDKLTN